MLLAVADTASQGTNAYSEPQGTLQIGSLCLSNACHCFRMEGWRQAFNYCHSDNELNYVAEPNVVSLLKYLVFSQPAKTLLALPKPAS
jgi:hypothetical protein